MRYYSHQMILWKWRVADLLVGFPDIRIWFQNARQIPPWRATACDTQEKRAGGGWGILNKPQNKCLDCQSLMSGTKRLQPCCHEELFQWTMTQKPWQWLIHTRPPFTDARRLPQASALILRWCCGRLLSSIFFLPFLLLLLPCMIDAFQKCQPLVLNHLSPSSTLFQPPTVNDCACLASCQFRLIFISLCDTICTKNLITWYKCFCFVGPNEILHSKYEQLAWFFRILCFFKCTTNPENDSLSRCFSATRVWVWCAD